MPPDPRARPTPPPRERGGAIGLLILLGALVFGTAVALDVGGLGGWFQRLITSGDPPPRAPSPPQPFPGGGPSGAFDAGSAAGAPAGGDAFAASPFPFDAGAPPPITQAWYLDAAGYQGALAEQKATRAPLVIYFRKRACDFCKRVDRELLAAPDVKQALARAVKARVDVDDGRRAWELTVLYDVNELPALVAVSPGGAHHPIVFQRGGVLLPPAEVAASIR